MWPTPKKMLQNKKHEQDGTKVIPSFMLWLKTVYNTKRSGNVNHPEIQQVDEKHTKKLISPDKKKRHLTELCRARKRFFFFFKHFSYFLYDKQSGAVKISTWHQKDKKLACGRFLNEDDKLKKLIHRHLFLSSYYSKFM